ncbi:MAG: hypothetical protein GKS05_07550 [Nitrospirales bacterium]|nr:hypothetical protein [Nitrospirales bacterium]
MEKQGTRFDRFHARVKNNSGIAILLLLGTAFIALLVFSDVTRNLLGLFV